MLWVKIILSLFTVIACLVVGINWIALRLPKLVIERQDPKAHVVLEDWFERLQKHRFIPFNGTVLIRRSDEILLRKAYGVDSQNRALSIDTPLRLGSVSKQFTAVGVLTLVRDGKVDLSAPISDYIPECDFSAPVETLLNHSSGIPDVVYNRAHKTDILTLEKVETLMCGERVKTKPLGTYAYSNTGYLLAARLIERVSGEPFETYMQREVFDALDMQDSRVWNLISTRPFPNRAGSFKWKKSLKTRTRIVKPLEPINLDGVAGDGGVFSNLSDLEIWDKFWADERLLPTALKQSALTPQSGDYAFGWISDGDWTWHTGAWLGARTYLSRNSKTGDLIILLENSSNPQVEEIGGKIRSFLERTDEP